MKESVLLVGNVDGKKFGGSMLQGGRKNDTVLAGEFDSISAGAGRDLVILADDREYGATINISEGVTTIRNMNNTFDSDEGNVLYIDKFDMDKTSFAIYDKDLVIKNSGEFKAIIVNPDLQASSLGSYMQQLVATDDGTYKVAIGNGTKIEFSNFPGKALIDLGGDWKQSSVGSGAAFFKGVNNIIGGQGKMILKGGDGNETLTAGKAATSLYGAGGNDLLVGGKGKDTFLYSSGNDVIANYATGDKISLGAAISKSTVKGSDAVFTIGSGTLTVKNGKDKKLAFIINDTERTIIGGAQLLQKSDACLDR